jgi:hypothetical protein
LTEESREVHGIKLEALAIEAKRSIKILLNVSDLAQDKIEITPQ